jgi:RNA polymerase sigma factor (TIGR02999 family)
MISATFFAPPRARGEAASMVAHRSDPPSPPGGHADAPSGDRRDLDEVFSAAYEELRRLAASVRRRERSVTLNPTALVNEAWIKLASNPKLAQTSLPHFKRIAARAMRQVLVEAARRRSARKRGGPDAVFVTFDESVGAAAAWTDDVVELDAALDRLARSIARRSWSRVGSLAGSTCPGPDSSASPRRRRSATGRGARLALQRAAILA